MVGEVLGGADFFGVAVSFRSRRSGTGRSRRGRGARRRRSRPGAAGPAPRRAAAGGSGARPLARRRSSGSPSRRPAGRSPARRRPLRRAGASGASGGSGPTSPVIASVPAGRCRSCRRRRAWAASAMDQRDAGSGSSIRPMVSVRNAPCSGSGGRVSAIAASVAIALRRSAIGGTALDRGVQRGAQGPDVVGRRRVRAARERRGEVERRAHHQPDAGQLVVAWVRAIPKSLILARSSPAISTLPGLTSRCTMPRGMGGGQPVGDLRADRGHPLRVEPTSSGDQLGRASRPGRTP